MHTLARILKHPNSIGAEPPYSIAVAVDAVVDTAVDCSAIGSERVFYTDYVDDCFAQNDHLEDDDAVVAVAAAVAAVDHSRSNNHHQKTIRLRWGPALEAQTDFESRSGLHPRLHRTVLRTRTGPYAQYLGPTLHRRP